MGIKVVGKKEQIVAAGKATQFGKGNKVAVGNVGPWTYRAQLAWIREQELDPDNLEESLKKLKRQKAVRGKAKINITRLVAITAIEKMLKTMDPGLFKEIINQTEGNLTQEIIIPATTPAPIDASSDEDAAAAYKSHIAK